MDRMNMDQKRENDKITLMIIPHSSAKVREVKITTGRIKQFLYVAVGFFSILLISVFGLLTYAVHLQKQTAEVANLKKINLAQEQMLSGLEKDTEQLHQKMSQVDQLDVRVRKAMGMELPEKAREKTPSRGEQSNLSLSRLSLRAGILRLTKKKIEQPQDLRRKMLNLAAENRIMTSKMNIQLGSLASVNQRVVYFRAKLAATPSILPVQGRLTSPFGWRSNPRREFHPGVDLAISLGTPVRATASGTVVFSGNKNGYGETIIISHGYGFQTLYGHNSALLAKVGDKVAKGQIISKVGSTGYSTGPHCHYEVHQNGQLVDPSKFF